MLVVGRRLPSDNRDVALSVACPSTRIVDTSSSVFPSADPIHTAPDTGMLATDNLENITGPWARSQNVCGRSLCSVLRTNPCTLVPTP